MQPCKDQLSKQEKISLPHLNRERNGHDKIFVLIILHRWWRVIQFLDGHIDNVYCFYVRLGACACKLVCVCVSVSMREREKGRVLCLLVGTFLT